MDHPLPDLPNAATRTKPANHAPVKSTLPVQEIFEDLSLLLTIDEILQLHFHLKGKTEDEVRSLAQQCRRTSAALSDSQRSSRSSLISRFSRLSQASSTSTASHDLIPPLLRTSNKSAGHSSLAPESDDPSYEKSSLAPNTKDVENDASYTLLGLSSPPLAQVASYGLVEESRGLNQAAACPPVGVTFPLANPAFPYPQAEHVPVASHICYACNKSCKNATTLTKHQNEFCERKAEWACPACQKVFGLQERLNRHHLEAHADSCPSGCDKREKSLSEACKMQFSKCSRQLATKKAWGCPCCVECFESFEEWSRHVSSHPIQNEKVQDWSYSTMIWSLLRHPYIADHVTWEQWQYCTWSKLSRELSPSLRHALERHEVPAAVSAHMDYSGLDGPAALAKYAFSLGTTGKAHPRECKTPKTSDVSFYQSPSPSSCIADGATDSSHYQSAADPVAHSPASWSLLREAHPNFRERVLSQANCQQSPSRQKLIEPTNRHCSEVEGSRHLPPSHSSGIRGYGHMNGSENRQVLKSNTKNPPYVKHPPMTLHDDSTSSLSYPPDWDPRRLQTKKSQANLHTHFTHSRDPTLHGYEDPPLPMPWQDPEVYHLENNSHGLAFDRAVTQRPQTASSRPATPARSEMSQGSFTRLLNTSSSFLPGLQYPVAMSLCGPPSDIDIAWQ